MRQEEKRMPPTAGSVPPLGEQKTPLFFCQFNILYVQLHEANLIAKSSHSKTSEVVTRLPEN